MPDRIHASGNPVLNGSPALRQSAKRIRRAQKWGAEINDLIDAKVVFGVFQIKAGDQSAHAMGYDVEFFAVLESVGYEFLKPLGIVQVALSPVIIEDEQVFLFR